LSNANQILWTIIYSKLGAVVVVIVIGDEVISSVFVSI